MAVVMAPNHRYSIIGKTGSGKTIFTIVLVCLLVGPDDPVWEVWWLDSKRDPRDQALLRKWGFGRTKSRKLIVLDPADGPIPVQANDLAAKAIARKNVLIVHDEYKHQCQSSIKAGYGIEDCHLRGRGLNVGQCGETQEPVYVPRQLLSQATHLYLFDLTYPKDIQYARTLCATYERPPDPYGFYYCHIDGDAVWRYYPHVKAWYDTITLPAHAGT